MGPLHLKEFFQRNKTPNMKPGFQQGNLPAPGLFLVDAVTKWPQTIGRYSPTVLEARSPRSRCQQERPRRGSFLPLPAPGGFRQSLVCGCITPISGSVRMASSLCIFSEDTIQLTKTPESEIAYRSDGV